MRQDLCLYQNGQKKSLAEIFKVRMMVIAGTCSHPLPL